jgi:hypothetical protein
MGIARGCDREGCDTEGCDTEGCDTEGRENLVSVTDDLPGGNQDRPVPRHVQREDIPNPETGVGIGARNDPDTFEPEEDPE